MKKRFYYIAVMAMISVAVFTACDKNEGDKLTDFREEMNSYSESVKDYEYIFTSSLKDIYENAYDGENIDENQAFSIFNAYSSRVSDIDLHKNQLNPLLTRSAQYEYEDIEEAMAMIFTTEQMVLIDELLGHNSINESLLLDIREKALFLSKNEVKLIIDIVDMIQISIKEVEKYNTIENLTFGTRSNKSQTFVCNMGAAMIGGVAGFLAGALTGTLTGPGGIVVTGIVSNVVGSYISTHAC